MAVGESFPGSSRTCCAIPGCPASQPWPSAFLPLGISEHTAIILLLSGYAGSLLALALGFHTRLSAFLAWGLHLSLVTSGFASYYGVDQLANTFLFYLFLFPSGRAWTFASRPASSRREETIPVGCLRVMQVHLCVIYLAAGLDKAMGSQWWNGEAIWQTVSQPVFQHVRSQLAGEIIPGSRCSQAGARWWWRSATRFSSGHAAPGRCGAIATIGLHLGTGLFMGLVFFSSVMILLTGCLFLIPEESPWSAPSHRGEGRSWRRSSWPFACRRSGCEARAARRHGASPTTSRPWSAVSWRVTRFRAWPWESSSGDTSSSPAASVTAMWTSTCR